MVQKTIDFGKLSATIKAAADKSNVGVSGLAQIEVNSKVAISDFREDVTSRDDITAENPLVIFKLDGKARQFSTAANGLPSMRVISVDAVDTVAAANGLKDIKFATGLTRDPNYCFFKEYLENLDTEQLNVGELEFTCVGKLNVPSSIDDTKPAYVPSAYVGTAAYYEALSDGDGSNATYTAAREALHKSGLKDGMAAKNPETAADAAYFVWVPVFNVTKKAA